MQQIANGQKRPFLQLILIFDFTMKKKKFLDTRNQNMLEIKNW